MKTLSRHRSPLRYPGGKQRAASVIADLFGTTPKRIACPFAGGLSVELELARRGHLIIASDAFSPVAAFWAELKRNPSRLQAQASEYLPITKPIFYRLQDELRTLAADPQADQFQLAWRFFVLNRSSFSGTTLSGGMGSGDRFTQSAIDRLGSVDLSRIEVRHGDYWQALFANLRAPSNARPAGHCPFEAVYADPPYLLETSNLYGDRGSTHDGFDHKRFARHMNNLSRRFRLPVVVSYNDCPAVRELFAGWEFSPIQWAYGMNASKKSNEVLITITNF